MMSKNKNLNNIFIKFLIPAILTAVAISLNEFVDGIVVANLLGSDALGLLNMAIPLLLLYAMFAIVVGIGGSVKYSSFIGELKKERAGEVFSLALSYSAVVSLVFIIVGIFFNTEIANILSSYVNYGPNYYLLVRIMLLSAPIIIITQSVIYFLPVAGKPEYATLIIGVSNIINLIFDFIFIRGFSMGVEGSALATTVGYVIGALIIILLVRMGKASIITSKISDVDMSLFVPIALIGLPSAIGQLSFVIKTYFGNYISSFFAGIDGVTTFSVCMQTMSMTGIIISGLVSTIIPIAGFLYGQKDFEAIGTVLDMAMKIQLVFSVLLFILLEAFPQVVLSIFNIYDPNLVNMAINGLKIFSFLYLFRGTIILFMSYAQIIERKLYSISISILEGFVVLIVLTYALIPFIGINALWVAFSLSELLILIGIVVINFFISRKSQNLKGFFLVEKSENEMNQILNLDERYSKDHLAEISQFIENNNFNPSLVIDLQSIVNDVLDYIEESGKKKKGCLEINIKADEMLAVRLRSLEKQPDIEKFDAKQDNLMGMYYTWLQFA